MLTNSLCQHSYCYKCLKGNYVNELQYCIAFSCSAKLSYLDVKKFFEKIDNLHKSQNEGE